MLSLFIGKRLNDKAKQSAPGLHPPFSTRKEGMSLSGGLALQAGSLLPSAVWLDTHQGISGDLS